MAGVALSLSGSLTLTRPYDCPPGTTDPGQAFLLGLSDYSRAFPGGSEVSQRSMSVDSPSAFVALAFPATLRGRVVYLRVRTGRLSLRLTHAGAGVVTYPTISGTFLAEFPDTEQVSAIEVQGQSSDFEWLVAGVLA